MELYNKKFINIIKDNLKNIEEKGNIAKSEILEPNKKEYDKVIKFILKFIEKKGRIIYGGKCWEALLKNKGENSFYKDYEMSDYEFYSYEPLKDLKELCDLLNDNNFKYVEGAGAQHDETFKVRVNYHEYCDITYMPKIIYSKMPKVKINNLFYSDFNFIIIDILRIFNDPLSSYWRISKNGERALKLFNNYKLKLNDKFFRIENNNNILNFVRKNILIGSKLIILGYYACNYYKFITKGEPEELYVPYYEVISTNLINDIENIEKKLNSEYGEIEKDEYHPFYQFTDRKYIFKYKDKPILIVYGNNDYCVPYKFLEKKNINIASYNVTLMYLLINSLYYNIYENKEKNNIDFLIKNLIQYRNEYLEKNNNTPLDNTPFQEFFIQCLGETYNTQIRFFQIMDKRNKFHNRRNIINRYHPDVNKNINFDKYNFKNTAGRKKN